MGKLNAGTVVVGAKIGPKLLSIAVKFAKIAKAGKLILAVGSMVSYAYLFTWQFAIIIMASLLFHESGHLYAMKRCGLKTKGIYFIPLMGAAAVSEEMFKSRRDEVYIAIMGPLWGFSLAILMAGIYFYTRNAFFGAVTGWMGMLNLFNLLPVNPLDGGRIMKSITFSINSKLGLTFLIVGIFISGILIFWGGLYLFLILLPIGVLETLFESRQYKRKEQLIKVIKESKDVDLDLIDPEIRRTIKKFDVIPSLSKKGIGLSIILYVVVVAILWGLMTYMNHIPEVSIARELFTS